MLGFLRRRPARGRRRLGAAVTAIPSAPVAAPAIEPSVPVVPGRPAGPLVQLGFRDGTSAELDAASEQAQALEELARLLTRGR
jgi:hypothetical protein